MEKLSRKEALKKASAYSEHPSIPPTIANRFLSWTHFQIRAYHRRVVNYDTKGRRQKSRKVEGYVFIHLAKEGKVLSRPIKEIPFTHMTRRKFAAYARGLTENLNNSLSRIFEN